MTSAPQERITDCSVYTYSDELIVELTGVDDDDVLVVISYQFDYDENQSTVEPKGTVDPEYAPYVSDGLEEAGYTWTDQSGS